jgi:hypothetical protein
MPGAGAFVDAGAFVAGELVAGALFEVAGGVVAGTLFVAAGVFVTGVLFVAEPVLSAGFELIGGIVVALAAAAFFVKTL